MYPIDSTDTNDTVEYLVEVGDDQRGEDAAQKAAEEHPEMSVLYWGLEHHSLVPLPPLGALVCWDRNTTV